MPEILNHIVDIWQDANGTFAYAFVDEFGIVRKGTNKNDYTHAYNAAKYAILKKQKPRRLVGEIASGQYHHIEESYTKMHKTLAYHNAYFQQIQLRNWRNACFDTIMLRWFILLLWLNTPTTQHFRFRLLTTLLQLPPKPKTKQ